MSYSDGFAAPEQVHGKINQIGFHTDIYSIGAILFYKLFNRKVNSDDGKISSQYDFTKMNCQNQLYQPKLYKELEKFFHKTISLSTFARWKNIDCVLENLDRLINLADVECVLNEISVNGIEQEEGESPKSFFDRKISVLCKILTPKDLMIVDNLDCDNDENFENLLECPCKFIITTRMDFSDYNFNQIEIGKIEDSDEITALFTTYNDNHYNEIEFRAVQKIIQLIENHTMTVELTAKYLRESGESPEILLKKFLEVEGTTNIEDVKIKQRKDTKLRSVSVTEHLRTLFNLSNFTNNEIEVMRSLSLLGGIRINQKYFMEMLKLSDSTAVESLKKRGWIESDSEKICYSANEIFAYDILQRFYRLKIKFTAQIDFFEEDDLVEICKRKLIEIKNFFESATNFCKIYVCFIFK